MTVLDWVLLLVIGVSTLLGALRGLIGVAASLAAWILAGLAAFHFGGEVSASLVDDGSLGWGELMGGYALSFVAVWVVVGLLGWLVRRMAHSAGLSGMDRTLGLGLGLVRGVFFACVLLLLLGLTSVPREAAWRSATLVPLLVPGAHGLRACLPPWMAQRVDLEGRGTSLQAQVQATAAKVQSTAAQVQSLPLPSMPALPAPVSEAATSAASAASVQDLLPQLLPGRQQAHDKKQVSPASDPHNVDSPGQASDDKLVH